MSTARKALKFVKKEKGRVYPAKAKSSRYLSDSARKKHPSLLKSRWFLLVGPMALFVMLTIGGLIIVLGNTKSTNISNQSYAYKITSTNTKISDSRLKLNYVLVEEDGSGSGMPSLKIVIKGVIIERMMAQLVLLNGNAERRQVNIQEKTNFLSLPSYRPVHFELVPYWQIGYNPRGTYVFTIESKNRVIYQEEIVIQ